MKSIRYFEHQIKVYTAQVEAYKAKMQMANSAAAAILGQQMRDTLEHTLYGVLNPAGIVPWKIWPTSESNMGTGTNGQEREKVFTVYEAANGYYAEVRGVIVVGKELSEVCTAAQAEASKQKLEAATNNDPNAEKQSPWEAAQNMMNSLPPMLNPLFEGVAPTAKTISFRRFPPAKVDTGAKQRGGLFDPGGLLHRFASSKAP